MALWLRLPIAEIATFVSSARYLLHSLCHPKIDLCGLPMRDLCGLPERDPFGRSKSIFVVEAVYLSAIERRSL